MDSFRFHDIRVEKSNAISKHRRVQKITTLFRCIEVSILLIVVSRFSSQFAFSFNLSTEYFRGISLTLISPRSVFFIGNAIVVSLFLISGQFSGKKGERTTDFYEEYVEKCRSNNNNNNNQQTWSQKEKRASDAGKNHRVCCEEKVLSRAHSAANLERAVQADQERRRRDLRRSVSDKYRKSVDCGRKAAVEEEMSSEEFRRTVEAFIARQQRCLREEEEFSAVVSFEA